jgi:8-oxo-dGTP pyrophosphatase MutT (NUDIX family)
VVWCGALETHSLKIHKVCPVITRHAHTEILLFKHPLAGTQLIKGTVEAHDVNLISAALRELEEESGILPAQVQKTTDWGSWESGFQEQSWHFVYCETADLPEHWSHFTHDDGGHHFTFFWHSLKQQAPPDCHPVFIAAITQIKQYI